jgi:very-short-patch-repair endonuclease
VRPDPAAVVGPDGWTTWELLTRQISPTTLRAWVADGRLVHLGPGRYATPAAAGQWRTRIDAALHATEAVASHTTALALWGLLAPPLGPVHVTVAVAASGRGSGGVVRHRGRDVDWHRRRVDGLPVTSVERSLVDAWGSPAGCSRGDLRGAAITAVRRRMCTTRALEAELELRPRLPGRAELTRLVRLLADGCQSELEIWGCLHVLRAPGMPAFVQQREVVVTGERVFLDAAYEEVLLAVEMDGAAWHGSREQRERDIRRDALLATLGWQTLRFSHRRLTVAAPACRQEIQATYDTRCRLLRPDGGRRLPVRRPSTGS